MRAMVVPALVGVLALAGCSTAATPSPAASSASSATAATTPTSALEPTPAPSTSVTPVPSVSTAPSEPPSLEPSEADEPAPSPPALTIGSARGERMLLTGVRRDLRGTCSPTSSEALATLRCNPSSRIAARVTLTLFHTQAELMDAYGAVLTARDIPPMSNGGRCEPGEASEGGFVPGDGHGIVVVERGACYRDANGKAHYVATLPPYVLVQVDGKVADIAALEGWAWRGNLDQPGSPTLWRGQDG